LIVTLKREKPEGRTFRITREPVDAPEQEIQEISLVVA